MYQKQKEIQKRYEGFLKTNSLWKNNSIFGLTQFEFSRNPINFDFEIDNKLRLGKYIEQFLFYHLKSNNFKILFENIQIQNKKITLGELDCILVSESKIIHLEVVYKFYLYDETIGNSEIDHFIGPNRKDCLIDKLNKLEQKQLPLLYSDNCKLFLTAKGLNVDFIEQQVCFLAQLFIPYKKKINLNILNPDSIAGYYISYIDLEIFSNFKFYIPIKKDWLVIPHQNISWLKFDEFKVELKEYMNRKFSPLCWLKKQNGEIFKIFITWW